MKNNIALNLQNLQTLFNAQSEVSGEMYQTFESYKAHLSRAVELSRKLGRKELATQIWKWVSITSVGLIILFILISPLLIWKGF